MILTDAAFPSFISCADVWGRSNRTAHAFLMYTKNKMLQETAEKRLSAMREYSDLGSGFKIAMKDLELRGGKSSQGRS